MKTISIDLKSFLIGILATALMFLLLGAREADNAENGRYRATASDDYLLILDTQTGEYILETSYIGKQKWIRGDFQTSYENGKNKTPDGN